MYYTLDTVLNQYVKSAEIFSFICATETQSVKLFDWLMKYYCRAKIAICSDVSSGLENLTVLENLFIEKAYALPKYRNQQIAQCQALLAKFQMDIDPHTLLGTLSNEEQFLLELIRAIRTKPEVLLLSRQAITVSYHYFEILRDILRQLQNDGCTILLVTSRWEDVIQICSRFAVMGRNNNEFFLFSSQEISEKPEQLMMALSGYDFNRQTESNRKEFQTTISTLLANAKLLNQFHSLDDALANVIASAKESLNASSCIIYLKDCSDKILNYCGHSQTQSNYCIVSPYSERFFVYCERLLIITRNSYDLSSLFDCMPADVQMIVCYPVYMVAEKIGYLQLTFSSKFFIDDNLVLSIQIISDEISRTIQTFKLVNSTILMQESNHRIKNNLQMIISLIYLQKNALRKRKDNEFNVEEIESFFDQIVNRIKTIEGIHAYLSQNLDESAQLPMRNVVNTIVKIYEKNLVAISMSVDDIELPSDKALLLAMVLNELINNCVKHAFSKLDKYDKNNIIKIQCKLEANSFVVCVHDNGTGLPEGFDCTEQHGIGMTIICALTKQMGGTVSFSSDHGTMVRIVIPHCPLHV